MRLWRLSLTAAACLLAAQTAVAREPDCCAGCGVKAPCQPKTCQVVCDVKTVKKHRWIVKCEPFCVPMPGCRKSPCKSGCGPVEECDQQCDAGCAPKGPVPPKCTPVRYRKKLVKQEYTVQVPVYKCVVKNLCGGCCEAEEGEVVEALPPAFENRLPAVDAAPLPPAVSATIYRERR